MTKVYLIGDTHYDHRNIPKYRSEFDSVTDHNESVHEKIMSVSNKRNILWLLGDNFFTFDSLKYLEEYSKYFLHVNWVLGNHDTDSPERQKCVREALANDYVNKVGSLFKIKGMWLSHHPIHPDELRGKFNAHGHVHGATIRDPNYMNLSYDNLIDGIPADLQKLRSDPNSQLKEYGYNKSV